MSKKIVAWNVNSIKSRLGRCIQFIKTYQPDYICLQEIKTVSDKFPYDVFKNLGYNSYVYGQKTYNGVAVLSKEDGEVIANGFEGSGEEARFIAVEYEDLVVCSVYVINGRSVDHPKYKEKLSWLESLRDWLISYYQKNDKPLVLGGDFNIARSDIDIAKLSKWQDKILCTGPERIALENLLEEGLVDSFRHIYPDDQSFSWWDYRNLSFVKNDGLRIDYIFCSEDLADSLLDAGVYTEERKDNQADKPSDHAPVFIEYEEY